MQIEKTQGKKFFLEEADAAWVMAELRLAKYMDFLSDGSLEEIEKLCHEENQRREKAYALQGFVYGNKQYTLPVFLQRFLSLLRLDYVSGNFSFTEEAKAKGFEKRSYSQKEKEQFYQENQDLFLRALGGEDKFSFEEAEDIIEKRLKEKEYQSYVQKILCECSSGF